MDPELGKPETAELLLKELVYDLRKTVSRWATLTEQTSQVRMGYVGQHLVSVVTSLKGSKSGARGYDLLGPGESNAGEVKTCNRVDQLGSCKACGRRVAAHERVCPSCGRDDIDRRDDSKWLLSFSSDSKFEEVQNPKHYYLVLFATDDKENPAVIDSRVWRVDPQEPAFVLCMADYYLPKRNQTSRAPFNWWPDSLKFGLMRPVLIFHSHITLADGEVTTRTFAPDATESESLLPLAKKASTLTGAQLAELETGLGLPAAIKSWWAKQRKLAYLDESILAAGLQEADVRRAIVQVMYSASVAAGLLAMPATPFYDRLRAMTQP